MKRKGTEQSAFLTSSQGKTKHQQDVLENLLWVPWTLGTSWPLEGRRKGLVTALVDQKQQGTSRRASWRRCWDSNCEHMMGFNGGENLAEQRAGLKGEAGARWEGSLKTFTKGRMGCEHQAGLGKGSIS